MESMEETELTEMQEEEIPLFDPAEIRRIALFRPGTLGDMILTTPLFAALKEIFPESELTVIANEWNSVIPENHKAVDHVRGIPSGLRGLSDWLRLFASGRFDLYIDPKDHRSTTSRIVAELIRAKRKLVVPANLPLFSGADIVPPPAGPHFVDSALAPMQVIAPETSFERHPSFLIPQRARLRMEEEIGKSETPLLLVNISTGSPTRRWPEEKWKEFVRLVDWNGTLVVISSPGDRGSGERIASVRPDARYAATADLMEAAALVDRATCLVTSDTSIVHIAGGLNRPILALYFNAPVMMRKFSPLSDIQQVLVAPDERPVEVIEVGEVLERFEEMRGEL